MEGSISSPLNTRIAVVTGGNKGIGLEVCRQLAGNGVTVVLTARDETRGAGAVERLRELELTNVIFHQLDITDATSITRLADFLKTRFGKLDILVNNAACGGVEYVRDPVYRSANEEELSGMDEDRRLGWLWENCRETYETAKEGLLTNYYGTKHLFRNKELKQELNDIDNLTEERLDEMLDMFLKDFQTNGVDARGWPKYFSVYKVAKAAMNAYSRLLARTHSTLHINYVHPGYVKTHITINSDLLTVDEGGSRVVAVALLPKGGPTAAFFEDFKESSFVTVPHLRKSVHHLRPLVRAESSWRTLMEGATSTSSLAMTRVAVVTGGNKGIGFEVCRQLAGNGVAVVSTARDEARGAAAVEKLKGLGLSNTIFHQLEVTDASSIGRLADFLRSRFGKIDILVNNAGVTGAEHVGDPSAGPPDEPVGLDAQQRLEYMRKDVRQTYETAKACLQTNYYGTKHVTEALLPLLQSSSDGRVVNISSAFGLLRVMFRNEELKQELNDIENLTEERLDEIQDKFLNDLEAGEAESRGWPGGFSSYKISKAAMNAYSRILARRHPELCINCVIPGYCKTDMNYGSGYLTPEEGGRRVAAVALLPEGSRTTGALFDDGKEVSFL
ncbi:hypothetical protein ACP4OV_004573 [Aristida adscensionis]